MTRRIKRDAPYHAGELVYVLSWFTSDVKVMTLTGVKMIPKYWLEPE